MYKFDQQQRIRNEFENILESLRRVPREFAPGIADRIFSKIIGRDHPP